MAGERIAIQVEVEPASDPIRGVARGPRGDAREFLGWVQLMAALEAARTPEAERSIGGGGAEASQDSQ